MCAYNRMSLLPAVPTLTGPSSRRARSLAVDSNGVIGCHTRLFAPAFSRPPFRARLFAPAFSRLISSLALPPACTSAAAASCRTKQSLPAVAVILLSCVLGLLVGLGSVQAQGTGGGPTQSSVDVGVVDGLTITTSADGSTGVTTPVNTDATFTATASAGTPKFVGVTPGWTIVGGATYKWYIDGAAPATSPPTLPLTYSPANTAKTTVTIPGASPAITSGYVVTINCAVTYGALGPDGKQPGYLTSSVSKTINVYLIGGPITGDKDEYFFCQTDDLKAVAALSAAPNQPAGTTYSWSISGPAIYCDGYGTSTTPTGATTHYRGTLPGSIVVGDVTANVTYSLNGVSAKSSPDWKITVHVPVTFVPLTKLNVGPTPILPPEAGNYGFRGQQLHFQVLDGVGQPVQNAYWDEIWDDSKTTSGGGKPAEIGDQLDAQGMSVDTFDTNLRPQPVDPAGDLLVANLIHTYYVTDHGQTGGHVGCPVQTYAGVNYYTYRMTGNGF